MKQWKKWLCGLLATVLALIAPLSLAEAALTQSATTLETVEEAVGDPALIHTDANGNIVFIEGDCAGEPILNVNDASALVKSMRGLLGGDAKADFVPWRTLTDTAGNVYYVFQQMYEDTTVSGGAIKIVTDASGNMLGLVSSMETELPEMEESEGITAAEAEAIVRAHEADDSQADVTLVEGRTEMVILPVMLELDMESNVEKEESHFVWVVYSDNPSGNIAQSSDLPYLAHYVTMEGEYLYSLPTIFPGDTAGSSGFGASYVFQFMEPVNYTGTVKRSDGTEQEITIDLMRDSRTGMVYLGNLERHIAVADCWEFLFNHGNVVLEASAENTGWDDTCLLSLYNYCRAWDYYRAIGWIGGDGLDTPMLVLKDYCDIDHNSVNNAAYAGKYYGWQVFLSSAANDFSQCLDVLAHEFTHCVTGSVMTYNAYKNDYGAINEAISDIHGNLCEKLMDDNDDEAWLLGEGGKMIVRSMSDPHHYRQPEYTWDINYVPKVQTPTEINDRGGVHSNSSLLNNVAYRLCVNGGMSLEDARAYWFAVDCSMVPGTDYAQLSLLMPWVMKNLGLEDYMAALEAAMDATRIRSDEMPDAFDDDRALLTLKLPDDEIFTDGNWALAIFSVNVDMMKQRADEIVNRTGEYGGKLDELQAILGLDDADIEALLAGESSERIDALTEEVLALFDMDREEALDSKLVSNLVEWGRDILKDLFYFGTIGAGQDGQTIRMVCRPGLTIPVLMRMEFQPDSTSPRTGALAAYAFGKWFNLSGVVEKLLTAEPDDLTGTNEDGSEDLGWIEDLMKLLDKDSDDAEAGAGNSALFDGLKDMVGNLGWLKNMIFYNIKGGRVNKIPATGLDTVTILDEEAMQRLYGGLLPAPEEEKAPAAEAEVDIDISALTLDQMIALRDKLNAEIEKR